MKYDIEGTDSNFNTFCEKKKTDDHWILLTMRAGKSADINLLLVLFGKSKMIHNDKNSFVFLIQALQFYKCILLPT